MENENIAAVYLDVDSLVPWGDNPRDNDQAVDAVADSIKRFGFGAPIVARKDDLMIIKGHTRRKAAIKLGLSKVPVRLLDIDLVDAQLLALADNKIGEIADWNDDKLSEIIHNLKEEEIDISGLGFTDEEIERLSDLVPDPDWQEFDEAIGEGEHEDQNQHDQIPAEVKAITKPGERIEIGDHVLHCGDCIEVLKAMPDNFFDSIVCDPPYGIGFMSKDWDCSVPSDDWAAECLRVLKPGGHLIAFAASRTIHRLMIAVEDSGFSIRDLICWTYFSGFPKSLDVSKAIDKHFGAEREDIGKRTVASDQWTGKEKLKEGISSYQIPITAPSTEEAKKWSGWGTALKPAVEPAVLARKPLSEKTVALNVLKWGTGGLNIDRSRFGYGDPCWVGPQSDHSGVWDNPVSTNISAKGNKYINHESRKHTVDLKEYKPIGRWPANLFQCPKASRSEREEGCEDLPSISGAEATDRKPDTAGLNNPRAGAGRTASEVRNIHPTVKPVKLMRWLIGLVTPEDGIVLDTFAGSGTTLVAAELEGIRSIGIEREPGYCDIIRARLKFHI
jgi:DNA modification methylase